MGAYLAPSRTKARATDMYHTWSKVSSMACRTWELDPLTISSPSCIQVRCVSSYAAQPLSAREACTTCIASSASCSVDCVHLCKARVVGIRPMILHNRSSLESAFQFDGGDQY